MNEEKLNISVRKFLKNVGITSQRKIEDKVRENVETLKITTSKKIKISAQLFSEDLNLDEKIEGEIESRYLELEPNKSEQITSFEFCNKEIKTFKEDLLCQARFCS